MVEREAGTGRNLSAKEAVEGIRGPLSNAQLMQKFKISTSGFADLLKQLFEMKLITEGDLEKRGIQFRVVRREPETAKPKQPLPTSIPAHLPTDQDEGFLDTEALTDLLAFKTPEPPAPHSVAAPPPESPPEKENQPGPPEKKSRFSITGLFKKST